jgi:hypothetical protein
MEPVILTWRPQNFITIFLMVVIIGVVVALVGQGVMAFSGSQSSSSQ